MDCFLNPLKQSLTKTAVPTENGKKRIRKEKCIIGDSLASNADILDTSTTAETSTFIIDEEEKYSDPTITIHLMKEEEQQTQEGPSTHEPPSDIIIPLLEGIKEQINSLENNIQSIGQTLQERIESPVIPVSTTTSTSKNKQELFKAIKKHINPVMATLLGMELFGSADHQWQEDEKELAMELHSQGESVYKFLRDEFRLRLPAISDVEAWKKD